MSDKLNQTQRILRSSKVKTDGRGRTVWADTVETTSLELMSTQMLKKVVESNDANANNDLRKVSEGKDGLLARDTEKGRFEIISDDELQQILDGTDSKSGAEPASIETEDSAPIDIRGEEELELVSTQMLRVVLDLEDEPVQEEEGKPQSGFDPYNSG